jgi:hypothetical protein
MSTEKIETKEEILAKHWGGHDTYYPNGDFGKQPIHDRDCKLCYYEDKIHAAMDEYSTVQNAKVIKENEHLKACCLDFEGQRNQLLEERNDARIQSIRLTELLDEALGHIRSSLVHEAATHTSSTALIQEFVNNHPLVQKIEAKIKSITV